MSVYDLDPAAARSRQQRVLAEMQRQQLDLVIVTQIEHVQWLAGPRYGAVFSPAAALRSDGHVTLVHPQMSKQASAADEVLSYDAQLHCTLRNDQRQASSQVLLEALKKGPQPKRIGVEFSSFTRHLDALGGELVDVEPTLYKLRRKKDADELAKLKKAIAGTGKMYELAREIIRPGISELEVFNRLQAAAVEEYGEMLTGTGNDYACGVPGGPPRAGRVAQDGELYILDLGPAFRGYFADNCRAFAVNGKPTDEQQTAWSFIKRALDHVQKTVKPGKSCKELFHEVQAILDQSPVGVFDHHLGHGIGLYPHEAPHLNPNWDDVFEVGDVFTAEPGLYDAAILRGGIRLENDFLVTETGVELLSDFPLEL